MPSKVLDSIMRALAARDPERDSAEAKTWATLLRAAADELDGEDTNDQGSD